MSSRTPARKKIIPEIARYFLAFWLVFLVYMNLPLTPDSVYYISYTKYIYFASCLIAVMYALQDVKRAKLFLATPLFKWLVFTISLFLLNIIRMEFTALALPAEIKQEEFVKFERIVMFLFFAYLVYVVDKTILRLFLTIAVVLGPAVLVLDILNLEILGPELTSGWEQESFVRADGLYDNANAAAEAAILCLLLISPYLRRNALTLVYVLVGIGVLFTFSRAGIGSWLAVSVILVMTKRASKYLVLVPVIFLLSMGLAAPYVTDIVKSVPGSEHQVKNLVDRLTFWAYTDADKFAEEREGSSRSERENLAEDTFTAILQRPLFGHGVSYLDPALDVGSHNQILALWYKFGIPGLICWVWLFAILWKHDTSARGWIRPAAVVFTWFSLFSHNLFEHAFWLLFIAMILFMNQSIVRRKTRSRKRSRSAKSRRGHARGKIEIVGQKQLIREHTNSLSSDSREARDIDIHLG